jgi:hypothetical protein
VAAAMSGAIRDLTDRHRLTRMPPSAPGRTPTGPGRRSGLPPTSGQEGMLPDPAGNRSLDVRRIDEVATSRLARIGGNALARLSTRMDRGPRGQDLGSCGSGYRAGVATPTCCSAERRRPHRRGLRRRGTVGLVWIVPDGRSSAAGHPSFRCRADRSRVRAHTITGGMLEWTAWGLPTGSAHTS